VRSLTSCHLPLFGHRTGHARLFTIAPRLAGATVASEAKQTKQTQQICMSLRGFLDMSPLFVFWRDIFTWGFGSSTPHQLLHSFLTGNRCSFLLPTSPTSHLLLVMKTGRQEGVGPHRGEGQGSFTDYGANSKLIQITRL